MYDEQTHGRNIIFVTHIYDTSAYHEQTGGKLPGREIVYVLSLGHVWYRYDKMFVNMNLRQYVQTYEC